MVIKHHQHDTESGKDKLKGNIKGRKDGRIAGEGKYDTKALTRKQVIIGILRDAHSEVEKGSIRNGEGLGKLQKEYGFVSMALKGEIRNMGLSKELEDYLVGSMERKLAWLMDESNVMKNREKAARYIKELRFFMGDKEMREPHKN